MKNKKDGEKTHINGAPEPGTMLNVLHILFNLLN